MNKKLIAFCCCLLLTFRLTAQVAENSQPTTDTGHWHIGLRGGVPLGISTFSSFGADKTRAGLSGGIYGGCRFNPVLSLEASAAWGKTSMSADKGITYLTSTEMDGMPRYAHKNNMICESGVRIGWRFGKCKETTDKK